MKSESKWQNNLYDKDDTENNSFDDNPLISTMSFMAVAIGGIAAYKSGVLSRGIKSAIKYISRYKSDSIDNIKAFREWINDDVSASRKSIIRNLSIKNIRNFLENGEAKDFTKEDIGQLKERLETIRVHKLANNQIDYKDTSLYKMIQEMNVSIENIAKIKEDSADKAQQIMMDALIKSKTVLYKDQQTSLKRTGFRKLTLGDVFTYVEEDGRRYVDYSKPDFSFDKDTENVIKSFLLKTTKVDGRKLPLIRTNKWKNIVIDNAILISKEHDIEDIRKINNTVKFALQSFTEDFKIPFIDMNPLALFNTVTHAYEHQPFFYTINKKTIQNALTGKVGEAAKIEKVYGPKTPLFYANGDVYKWNGQDFNKIKGNMYDIRIPKNITSPYGLPREVNTYRKIYGLSFKKIIEDENESTSKTRKFYNKLMKSLDLFRQDTNLKEFNIFEPSTYINYFYSKAFGKNKDDTVTAMFGKKLYNFIKPYKSSINTDIAHVFGKADNDEETVILFNKSNKFKGFKFDLNKSFVQNMQDNIEYLNKYFKQFYAGRKNINDVNYSTTIPYYLFERMNESISPMFIGLSNDSMGSLPDVFKNMMLKRFLPIVAAVEGLKQLDTLMQYDDGKKSIKKQMIDNYQNIDIQMHHVWDKVGLTNLFKHIAKLTPGHDQITEMPILSFMNPAQSAEERMAYFKNGMVPVRKGRFWPIGSTPYTGDKIEYYKPIASIRGKSNYKFTNTLYGSRSEYFKHTWYPNIFHPLAPVRHFITDRYFYEKKHYNDRPYMQTSPAFENVPIIGPLLSIPGRIIKPRVKMHKEYWNGIGALTAGTMYSTGTDNNKKRKGKHKKKGHTNLYVTSGTDIDNNTLPDENSNEDIYETSSGNVQIIKIDKKMSIKELKRIIKNNSINQVQNTRVKRDNTPKKVITNKPISNSSLPMVLSEQYRQTMEVYGMYGFMSSGFVTGSIGANATVIESSGYMTSMNRSFYDAEIGGLGGDVNEIFRRFVPKRRKDINFFNPIKNTMPKWIPGGNNYFLDLTHGDPYSKITLGEMRLPGEAYEKIYNIHPMRMSINADILGKDKKAIYNRLLYKDILLSDNKLKMLKKDNELKADVIKKLRDSNMILKGKGIVEDTKNHISGKYNTIINDNGVPAIMQIKVLSNKEFKHMHNADDADISELNFLLKNAREKKGYIYYLDRQKPNKNKIYTVQENDKLYNKDIKHLNETRNYIRSQIKNNYISRGDLYSPFERYKILADVAPYSQEFKNANALLTKVGMTKEQEAEKSEIIKRVRAQKQPFRLYPYKFLTAKTVTKKVHITKIIDQNTFLTKEFPNHPIRFAGIHVSKDKSNPSTPRNLNMVHKFIHPHEAVTIAINPTNTVQKDTLDTIHAVVYKHGTNVNRYLLSHGYANEKDKEDTPAGIQARYSPTDILFGRIWERVTHLNIPIVNSKIMQVRSPYEDYKRKNVYGQNFSVWQHPIRGYLKPAIYSAVASPYGLITGGLIGAMFGSGKLLKTNGGNRYGKLLGVAIGLGTIITGKTYKYIYEHETGEKWIPKERRKERELNEYVDILKYIKYTRLYKKYAYLSKIKDHFNIDNYLNTEKQKGNKRKKRAKALMELKKYAKIHDSGFLKLKIKKQVKKTKLKYKPQNYTSDSITKAVNMELNEIVHYRNVKMLPDNAMKAAYYKEKAKHTMYGYQAGDPVQNIFSALPKMERDYFKYFMKAPKEERLKILNIAPRYLRRPLESVWGLKVESRPDLSTYFLHHALPNKLWRGWNENVNLDDVKVKLIKHNKLDNSNFNVWREDVNRANLLHNVPLPKVFNYRKDSHATKQRIKEVLSGMGLKNIEIMDTKSAYGNNVSIELKKDDRDKLKKQINQLNIN